VQKQLDKETMPDPEQLQQRSAATPLEPVNRKFFSFNQEKN
jgi:hypothetical protein